MRVIFYDGKRGGKKVGKTIIRKSFDNFTETMGSDMEKRYVENLVRLAVLIRKGKNGKEFESLSKTLEKQIDSFTRECRKVLSKRVDGNAKRKIKEVIVGDFLSTNINIAEGGLFEGLPRIGTSVSAKKVPLKGGDFVTFEDAAKCYCYNIRIMGKELTPLFQKMGYTDVPSYEEDADGFLAYLLRKLNQWGEDGGNASCLSEDDKAKILEPYCKLPFRNLPTLISKLNDIKDNMSIGTPVCDKQILTAILYILYKNKNKLSFNDKISSFEKFKKIICNFFEVPVPSYKENKVRELSKDLQNRYYCLSQDLDEV